MRSLLGTVAVTIAAVLLGGVAWAIHGDTSTPETAAATCSEHHGFGSTPIDVGKTTDGRKVLAQVGWGANERGDCYLVLDDHSLKVLRDYEAHGGFSVTLDELAVVNNLKTIYPSLYECVAAGSRECIHTPRPETPGSYCTPDLNDGGMYEFSCSVRGTDWHRMDRGSFGAQSYLEADSDRSQFVFRGALPSVNVVCWQDDFSVYIRLPGVGVVGQDDIEGRVPVVYRLGEVGAAVQYEWYPADANEDGYESNRVFPPDSLAFARDLANSTEFVITLWNQNNTKIGPLVFDTVGSAREIKRVMDACGIDRYPSPNTL